MTGNQGPEGLLVENRAGERTILLANEPPQGPLPETARRNYRVIVGEPGDTAFVRRFHGRERTTASFGKEAPMRWSTGESRLILPVPPGRRCLVTVELFVPGPAVDEQAGLYLGEKRLAAIGSPGLQDLRAEVPAQDASPVTLSLRCREWSPADSVPPEGRDLRTLDARRLGVVVYSVTVAAEGASGEPFDANRRR